MIGPVLTIARNTFTESIRQPIFVVMVLFVGVIFLLGAATSAYTFADDTMQMIVMGLSMMLAWGAVTAALTASGVLNREIENKTALTVISKPVGRPLFVIGKYLGVAGAISLAMWIWSLIFLLTIRHKVLSAAGDQLDGPVLVFGSVALLIAVVLSVWGNYFYNWVFASTFVRLFAVTISLAYLLVLLINRDWQFQSILTEFDPDLAPVTNYGEEKKSLVQVIIAILLVFEAVWILTAIAIAASTRLGQVMTLLICLGAGALGVVNDGLFGSKNSPIARTIYHILPNFQFFSVADALTQKSAIDGQYIASVSAYAGLMLIAVLGLAIALFETRETG